mgnify:CR=1 FL=1
MVEALLLNVVGGIIACAVCGGAKAIWRVITR